MTDLSHLREDFPILTRGVPNRPLAYLDSAATTQKPVQVLDAVDAFYRTKNIRSIVRWNTMSAEATDAYEGPNHTV